jgi:predicted dehydrogenase
MPDITATVIGADGRMGREHVAAYESLGVDIISVTDCIDSAIVSIAAPDSEHGNYVDWALDNASHVFCEKPLYTTVQQGLEIKQLANPRLHIAQNFPLRYAPCFNLYGVDFGDIYRVEATYNWGRTHKLSETWRASDPSYSLVLGGLIHMVDLVLYVTGLDMEVVSAIGVKSVPNFPNFDTVMAHCRLSNGAVCNLTVDGGTGVTQHGHSLRIVGTKLNILRNNTEPTDKQAAIREFVNNIRTGGTPVHDFRAVDICLKIESLASTSVGQS